jgi:predicted nuclease of predicted toxin-antitoxin system
MIRFLIDAQLPPGLARRFASRGYPAEHVNRISLGIATDLAIWRHAARTGATLVTKDEDFVALARRETHGPRVVWVRIGNISNDALWRSIEPSLDEVVEALKSGERIVEVF